MRSMLVAILLCSSPAFADVAPPRPEPVKPTPKKPAPKPSEAAKFPLPKDADAGSAAGGGGGKITMHKVPRGRDAVVTEVRELLKKDGWEVTKDTKSPSGNAIRLETKKGETVVKASFTGDDKQTAIILTLP